MEKGRSSETQKNMLSLRSLFKFSSIFYYCHNILPQIQHLNTNALSHGSMGQTIQYAYTSMAQLVPLLSLTRLKSRYLQGCIPFGRLQGRMFRGSFVSPTPLYRLTLLLPHPSNSRQRNLSTFKNSGDQISPIKIIQDNLSV